MNRITRIEVIDENGRSYVNWEDDNDVSWQFQDDGRTLKVFVNTVKPKTGEEGALEALDKFQNDWLLGKKCPETKLEIKKLDSVESIKAEIKVLQSKLEFYEELEKQPKTLFDVIRNLGYSVDACYEIVDAVEEFQKPKEYQPTPQTPEQVEEGLKEAFKEAQQTEKWKETQKKIDTPRESWMDKPIDELVAILEKNPPDCLRFELSPSLEDRIYKWWNTCFTTHCEWSMEECVEDLLDVIESFLPRSQSSEGSQDIYACVAVDIHNDLLKKIKSKLRNKK